MSSAAAHEAKVKVHGPADNYVYELAAPGSYHLPRIEQAAGGQVLDDRSGKRDLRDFLGGKVTVLAFIYTRCGDVCPMATMRLSEFRDMAVGRGDLKSAVRLVTLSFDPAFDTPEVMADYASAWRDEDRSGLEWAFLTTTSAEALRPILKAYGQPVAPKRNANDPSGPISHLMRVFLIDRDEGIRNIYSADFLDARLIMNDVLTLVGKD
jgi:cytochrome oxidase Cu insertion factor (SCO1/SenC/PrrC family)